MFNRFTERARKVIILAKEEARRFNHDYIGTEHLLLGILKEGEGIGIKILQNLNCDLVKLKKAIEDATTPSGGTMTIGNLPLSKRAERALKMIPLPVVVRVLLTASFDKRPFFLSSLYLHKK